MKNSAGSSSDNGVSRSNAFGIDLRTELGLSGISAPRCQQLFNIFVYAICPH